MIMMLMMMTTTTMMMMMMMMMIFKSYSLDCVLTSSKYTLSLPFHVPYDAI
jgi:hypothetical protein